MEKNRRAGLKAAGRAGGKWSGPHADKTKEHPKGNVMGTPKKRIEASGNHPKRIREAPGTLAGRRMEAAEKS